MLNHQHLSLAADVSECCSAIVGQNGVARRIVRNVARFINVEIRGIDLFPKIENSLARRQLDSLARQQLFVVSGSTKYLQVPARDSPVRSAKGGGIIQEH